MNAFQIGICTYKWNETKACYVSRPFNAYVWPHSDILGDPVMQFKSSNIRFLMKHKFDFNKLFNLGINYQRLENMDLVKQKIDKKLEQSKDFIADPQDGVRYAMHRSYTKIGSTSQALLQKYLRVACNFA